MNLILFLSALTLAHCDVVGENKDKLVLAQVVSEKKVFRPKLNINCSNNWFPYYFWIERI